MTVRIKIIFIFKQQFTPSTTAAAPPLLSSSPAIRWFGIVVTMGLAVTLGFFFVNLVSVWCFFAAIASAILVGHFWRGLPRPAPVSS